MKPERKAIALPAVLAVLAVSGAGCADRSPAARPDLSPEPSGLRVNRVGLTRLQPMGEACEKLYDSAGAGDWETARRATAIVASEAEKTKENKLPAVSKAVRNLQAAVKKRDVLNAQQQANQLYRELLSGTEPYNASVPSSLNQLRYFAREVQLGCRKNDRTAAAADIRRLLTCLKATDLSVSDAHKADKNRLTQAGNELNHAFSAGDLKTVSKQAQKVLDAAEELERDCVGESE